MKVLLPEEYRALREGAAVLDTPAARARIAAFGADRLPYLHAMLTNDVAALVPGTGCYAAYLTPQGRMIADMLVLELGDLTLLDVGAPQRATVLEKLEQFIFSEDVRLSDLTPELLGLRLAGPRAADVLVTAGQGFGLADLQALPEYHSLRGSFQGTSVVAAADRELGITGFNLYLSRDAAGAFDDALCAAGATTVTPAAAEVLRIEAGRPRFGVDMDDTTIPLEAGIENRAISFTKGCFPGQEVITRVLHRGHGRIAKKLAGLRCEAVVESGDRVMADDKEIGRVTSAAVSPALQRPIALAYLQRDFTAPGADVSIVHAGSRVPAAVVELPFVPVD